MFIHVIIQFQTGKFIISRRRYRRPFLHGRYICLAGNHGQVDFLCAVPRQLLCHRRNNLRPFLICNALGRFVILHERQQLLIRNAHIFIQIFQFLICKYRFCLFFGRNKLFLGKIFPLIQQIHVRHIPFLVL